MEIREINLQTGSCIIEGQVFQLETREIRNNNTLVTFNMSDGTDSITVKVFLTKDQSPDFLANVTDDCYVRISGDVTFDNYSKSIVTMLKSLSMIEKEEKQDLSEEKRIELHLHTKMSAMDGIGSLKDLAKRAKQWGHEALAITDHGVVQAFPEAMELSKSLDLKMIYGMEGYMVNNKKEIVTNYTEGEEYTSYVVFDIETTGLSAINDKITEIGAIRVVNGEIKDTYSQLVNPERSIPEFITNLTGITDEMVKDKPAISEVIVDFNNFIRDDVLVAHNAIFDIGFIRQNMRLNDLKLNNPVLDTLELSRTVFPDLKNHKLNNVAKHLGVSLENHHRAVDDATATAEIFIKTMDLLNEKNINTFSEINRLNSENDSLRDRPFHVIILAKNLIGLKNLYKLVSESHMK